jgi:hypothetical protein
METVMEYNQENAAETLKQMGGTGRLTAMTGANNFAFCDKGAYVGFKFKMCKLFNYIQIKLNSMDTYDVTFMKIWGCDIKKTEEINGVYADQLVELFETKTGLYLSL